MPEASVNKDYHSVFWQNDIRTPWQALDLESKPVSHSMEHGTDCQFRLCIFAPDS